MISEGCDFVERFQHFKGGGSEERVNVYKKRDVEDEDENV